jgi:hypothetical protein
LVTNCSTFRLFGVEWVNDLNMSYDTGADQPSDVSSAYEVVGVGRVNDTLALLIGAGSLRFGACPQMGTVAQDGDRTLTTQHSSYGALTLSGTTVAQLFASTRGTASVGAGTPSLSESSLVSSQVFAASVLEIFTFAVPQPNTSYAVFLDSPTLGQIPQVTAKTTAGFDISFAAPFTGTVFLTVLRQM